MACEWADARISKAVTPAKAGPSFLLKTCGSQSWVPAFAGMTGEENQNSLD